MANDIHHPHDYYFKSMMSHIDIAYDFFISCLPDQLLSRLDLSTLTLEKDSFISSSADIVYSARWHEDKSKVYLLCEHKSYSDAKLVMQVFKYQVQILMQSILQDEKHIPIVIPICLYHGKQKNYPHSLSFWDCFSNPETAREFFMNPIQLVNLNTLSNEKIAKFGKAKLLLAVQKHIHAKNFLKEFEFWMQDSSFRVDLMDNGHEEFKIMVDYIAKCADVENLSSFVETFSHNDSKYEEIIMTLQEIWLQQGMQQGMQLGLLEGEKKGVYMAMKRTSLKLLNAGFSREQVLDFTQLTANELDDLLETDS